MRGSHEVIRNKPHEAECNPNYISIRGHLLRHRMYEIRLRSPDANDSRDSAGCEPRNLLILPSSREHVQASETGSGRCNDSADKNVSISSRLPLFN